MGYVLILGDSVQLVNYDVYHDSLAELIQQYYGLFGGTTDIVIAAESGARMSGGSAKTIPQQYSDSVNTYGVPDVVIFDGGTNDITNECSTPSGSPPCGSAFWDQLYGEFDSLFDQMVSDGVTRVVYGGPYHLAGTYAQYNNAIDYFWQNLIATFPSTWPSLNIQLVDPRPAFDDHPEYISVDNVHPTVAGSYALADLVVSAVPNGWIEPAGTWHLVKAIPLMMSTHNQVVNTNYVDGYANNVFKWRYTASDYSATDVFMRLEVDAYTNNLNSNASVALFDVTSSGIVTASAVQVYNTTANWGQSVRSAPFFPSDLVDGHEYRVRLRSGSTLTTIYVKAVRLLIFQRANITATATEHSMLTAVTDAQPQTTSTTYTATIANGRGIPVLFDADRYDGTVSVYFEANIYTSNASYTGYVALYDSGGNQVSGSQVSVTGTTLSRVRSGAITLTGGTTYHPRVRTSAGTAYIRDIRLIIKQSGTITKTSLQQRLCGGPLTNANPDAPTNLYGTLFSVPYWQSRGSANNFKGFEAYLKISDGAYTATATEKYDNDSSPIETLTTNATTLTRVASASSLTLTTGARYKGFLKSNSTSATAEVVGTAFYTVLKRPYGLIDAGGIASSQAVGTPTVSAGGALTLSPQGIASAEAHGEPAVVPGAAQIACSGIASAEAHGTAEVLPGAAAIECSGIESAEGYGTADVVPGAVELTCSGISSGEAHGTADILPGPVAITCSGIASAEATGAPELVPGAVSIACSGIPSAEAHGTAAVLRGEVQLLPAGISSHEIVSEPTIVPQAVAIAPSAIMSAEAIGSHIVTAGALILQPSGIASAEQVGTAELVPQPVEVAPQSIATNEAFGDPALTAGAVLVQPAGIASSEIVSTGTQILPGSAHVQPSGIESACTVGTPALQPGHVELHPDGIPSSEVVSEPIISAEHVTLAPSGIESAEAVGSAQVLPQQVYIQPDAGIASAEAFGVPLLAAQYILQASGIASQETVSEPTIESGPAHIIIFGIASAEAVPSPWIRGEAGGLQPYRAVMDEAYCVSARDISNYRVGAVHAWDTALSIATNAT